MIKQPVSYTHLPAVVYILNNIYRRFFLAQPVPDGLKDIIFVADDMLEIAVAALPYIGLVRCHHHAVTAIGIPDSLYCTVIDAFQFPIAIHLSLIPISYVSFYMLCS